MKSKRAFSVLAIVAVVFAVLFFSGQDSCQGVITYTTSHATTYAITETTTLYTTYTSTSITTFWVETTSISTTWGLEEGGDYLFWVVRSYTFSVWATVTRTSLTAYTRGLVVTLVNPHTSFIETTTTSYIEEIVVLATGLAIVILMLLFRQRAR